jgi:hypothetical protein
MQPPKPIKPQGEELRIKDPAQRHETRDINITGVLAFVLTLAFCGLVIFVVLFGVFHFATRFEETLDQKEMRDPWTRAVENQVDQAAKKLQTPENKATEPGSMQISDAESRVRVSRFPQPRLQTDDVRDLAVMREAEDVYLNQYFVIDKNAGKVNLPITQAMRSVVRKGLPATQPAPGTQLPPAAEGTGIVRPSISSSHAKRPGGAPF